MVQSARVQKIVQGDDVNLLHQIVDSVALLAEESRVPILVNNGDVVKFFYPTNDGTLDQLGYLGVPVGAYPESKFTVDIPGQIPALVVGGTVRGTIQIQSGAGRCVRAEITRKILQTLADTTLDSDSLANVASFVGVELGQSIVGLGIPFGALVAAFDSIAGTIKMSTKATATAVGVTIVLGEKETHYAIDEVDVFKRGFPSSLDDTSAGTLPAQPPLNLT